jgi:hypothetical protein
MARTGEDTGLNIVQEVRYGVGYALPLQLCIARATYTRGSCFFVGHPLGRTLVGESKWAEGRLD